MLHLFPPTSLNARISFQNLDNDIESSFVEPYLRFIRNQPTNVPGVLLVWAIFIALGAPMELLRRLKDFFGGVKPRAEDGLLVLQIGLLCSFGGVVWGLTLWTAMQGMGLLLLVIVSTPVHRSSFAWTAGCESVRAPRADFGEQTVMATNDMAVETAGLAMKLFVFGSFNDHITHHLFPTLDLSKQHLVRPLFLQCCRDFGVPYRRTAFPAMLASTLAVLRRSKGELMYDPPQDLPKGR